ncbi:MAG: hypothetical protein GY797_38990 [Deltaproteobacteria bacterium]|nr:hypothetical protein [Deltaproteobacteria bacterium]
MSLKIVHQNMMKIKQESGTNAKISLLTEMLKNDTFRSVITLMYDDSKHFKVNKLPKKTKVSRGLLDPTGPEHNQELFAYLEKLALQKGTSNSDKQKLCRLASVDDETFEVVTRIVNKDAKCGIGGKSINKAWADLLFLMPYCRCSTEKAKMSNIDYERGAIGQEKADGMFDNIIIDADGGVLFRSRNGNIIHQLDHLKMFLHKAPRDYRDTVYMGELLIRDGDKIFSRKKGNGILSSCLQNTADQTLADKAIIKLWDAVPQKDFWAGHSEIAYKFRLGRVANFVRIMQNIQPNTLMSKIESKTLYSLEEAQIFYRKKRKEGKEGAIIKNQLAKWKDHTSPDQVKMKNVSDAELRIVGWKYGKADTRFHDCMGSVQLKSDDDLIFVSVSGFKDHERLEDWDARIGKVATLEYDGIISDKSKPGIYSLYLPRNLEMRPDRSDTDTYKSLKKR